MSKQGRKTPVLIAKNRGKMRNLNRFDISRRSESTSGYEFMVHLKRKTEKFDEKKNQNRRKKHASEIFASNACLFQKQLLLYIFRIFTKARANHLSLLYYFLFLRKSGILICVSWRIGRNGCAGAGCVAAFGAVGCAGAAADGARKVGAL